MAIHPIRATMLLVEALLDEAFSVDSFLQKLAATKELAQRGASEGERSAAQMAVQRLIARAKAEMPNLGNADQARLKRAVGITSEAPSEEPPPPRQPNGMPSNRPADYPSMADYWKRFQNIPVEDVLPTANYQSVTFVGPGWAYVERWPDDRLKITYHWTAASRDELIRKIVASGFTPSPGLQIRGHDEHWACNFDYVGGEQQVINMLKRGGYTKSPH